MLIPLEEVVEVSPKPCVITNVVDAGYSLGMLLQTHGLEASELARAGTKVGTTFLREKFYPLLKRRLREWSKCLST
jgi:hypothetical protein